MTSPATVEGGERLRLFVALPLPGPFAAGLAAWAEEHLAGGDRLVPPERLHVTLAFLGSRPASDAARVADELDAAARVARPPLLAPGRYRETGSVGMVVLDDEDGRASRLAADVHARLERIGVYRPERRPWLPHVTVLRFRRRPGLRPPPPGIAPAAPSEAAVYLSVLRPAGPQYSILHSVALGG